jgi:hypothetical protein
MAELRNFKVSISLPELPPEQNEVEFRALRAETLPAACGKALARVFSRSGYIVGRRPTRLILTAEDISARMLPEECGG